MPKKLVAFHLLATWLLASVVAEEYQQVTGNVMAPRSMARAAAPYARPMSANEFKLPQKLEKPIETNNGSAPHASGSQARGFNGFGLGDHYDLGVIEKFVASLFDMPPYKVQHQRTFDNKKFTLLIDDSKGRIYLKGVESSQEQLRCYINPKDWIFIGESIYGGARSLSIGISESNDFVNSKQSNGYWDHEPEFTLSIPTSDLDQESPAQKRPLDDYRGSRINNLKLVLEVTDLLAKIGMNDSKTKSRVLFDYLGKIYASVSGLGKFIS